MRCFMSSGRIAEMPVMTIAEAGVMESEQEVTSRVDKALAFAESSASPAPEDALLHVFWEDR